MHLVGAHNQCMLGHSVRHQAQFPLDLSFIRLHFFIYSENKATGLSKIMERQVSESDLHQQPPNQGPSPDEWETHHVQIHNFYIVEGMTLVSLMARMATDFGFKAS